MPKQPHTYNSGRIHRANGKGRRPVDARDGWEDEYLPPPVPLKRKKRWAKVLLALLLVFTLLGAGLVALWNYVDDAIDPGLFGQILPFLDDTPREYRKDYAHILIVGIDYEEGRDYGAGLGLTDMILYARFDTKANKLNLMQIPRDSYVGESYATGGTGKINGLLISGDNSQDPINNLVGPFRTLFQLPVDYYIAMDMDALKAIVDTFGGLRVYVPRTMDYGGGHLDEGWQWLDGNAAEFFVRTRKGAGFERGDIDRLDNQRHFYSALFRRFLNMSAGDIVNLLPVFKHYCNTNIEMRDLIGLGVSALKLEAEGVLFCRVPGATGPELDPSGRQRSLYIVDLYGRGTEEDPGLVNLINWYFRHPDDPVTAEEMGLPQIQIPASTALYPPNVQGMANVQEGEGGAAVDVEPVA